MRGTVHGKLLTIFVVLSALVLALGLVISDSTRRMTKLNQELAMISSFELQVKDLQLMGNRLQEAVQHGSDLSKQLTKSQSLLKALHAHDTGFDSHHNQVYAKLTSQLESFRQVFLELLTLHENLLQAKQIHHELLELINQRLAYMDEEIAFQITPRLESFSLLQERVQQPGQEDKYLVPMRSLHDTIVGLSSDAKMIEAMHRLMAESDSAVRNKAAIQERHQLLEQIATSFLTVAEAARNEISTNIAQGQARLKLVALVCISALFAAMTLFFLLSKQHLKTFLHGLNLSMQAIRAGDFDYQTPTSPPDELGEQVRFIKEVATTLKHNLHSLSASEQRFRNLIENISDWIWMVDAQGICTYSSPLVGQMLGLAADTIVGQSFLAVLNRGGNGQEKQTLAAALAKQEPFTNLLHEQRHRDGQTVYLNTSGRPLTDSNGQFHGFTLISSDISNRQRTEIELAKSSRANFFLNQILELALLDLDLHTIISRFLGLMTGCAWINTQPRAVFFLIDKSNNSLVMTAHRGIDSHVQKSCRVLPLGTCLCGRAAQSGKVIFAGSDDSRHEMSYHGMAAHCHYCLPVHTVAGEIIGVVGLYLNPGSQWDGQDETVLVSATTIIGSIIRRRQTEDALSDLNQNLERQIESRTAQLTATNQELDSFAYSISHDLRAPLRAIDGFSLALEEDFGPQLPAEAGNYLARIRSGCTRMSALIDGILRLSRLTRTELDWHPLDLSQMAKEIIEEIQTEDPQREVEWVVGPNIWATADPTMLRIVLTNLLGNAWKYTAGTALPRIEFGARPSEGGEEIFFVKDNGAGFDMGSVDRLFKAFQRLHSEDEFSGNGIGLATVQRILHRHGGRIWAAGKVGNGATFHFTLGKQDAID